MSTPNPATANNSARSQGCAGVGADDCRYCMRQGLPILPVRYAICQVEENPDVPDLPEERISELYPHDADGNPVPIDLDTEIDEDGNAVSGKEKKNKYILRKLRGGFLYVYDEGNDRWYAFAISETAELLQFRPGEPPDDATPQAFACDQDSHRASAALLTLPNVASTKTAWLAYVESPWSEEFLTDVASDSAWRERHMQRFDVDDWLNNGHARYAFPQAEIAQLVPEYRPSGQGVTGAGDTSALTCTGSAAMGQLNGHCLPPRLGATGRELEDLLEAMDERVVDNRDLDGKAGQGVMLAIKDEVGILEELNDYRHRPIEELRAHQAADEKNARDAQWLASVNQLKVALEETAQAQIHEIDSSLTADIESLRQSPAGPAQHYRLTELRSMRHRRIASAKKDLKDVLKEFTDYYDDGEQERIAEDLQEYQNNIDAIVPRMDADYSQWLVHGLCDALDRYDNMAPRYGLRVTEIVSNVLLGGVLSPNSEWAWQSLMEQLDDATSPIVRAYLHNHRDASAAFVADALELGEGKSFFGEVKLKEWYDLLKGLRDVANNGWGRSDFNASRKALSQLGSTILGAGGALLGQEAADQAAREQPVAPRTGLMVRYARLLQVDSLVTAPDASFESGASYVVEMEVSMGDYRRTVSYLANPDGSSLRSRHGETQYVDPLENGERIGGNLPDPDVTDSTCVKVLWQIRDSDLARVAGYVEGIGPEALTAGGEPVRIPMVDQQLMMAEQQRLRGRFTNADKATKLFDAVFALVSFYEVGKSIADKPQSLENWWKMLGAMAAITQIPFDVAAGIEVRRGLAASGTLADARVIRGAQYGSAAKHLGRVVGAIGIIDGFRALGEAGAMARRGELHGRVRDQAFLAGIGIGGGLLTIAVSSLVLIPLIIGVITLVLAYWLVQLVPLNVRTWLRRSLYGLEQESYRFQPFANAQEEQESLMMVFSGIEFDMEAVRFGETIGGALMSVSSIQPGMPPRPLSDAEKQLLQTVSLTVTAGFPEELAGSLTVLVNYRPEGGDPEYLGGAKYADGGLVRVNEYGQELTPADSRGVGRARPTIPDGNAFELEQDGERKKMLFETDLEAEGGRLEARVLYYTEMNEVQRGDYVMELSR